MSTSWGTRAGIAASGLGCALLLAGPAVARDGGTATGLAGQQVSVTPVTGLGPDGQDVVVTGTGFDPAKGVYVALCVVPGPGEKPTPCGGGADTTGATGSSAWISSDPPSYAVDLVTPYDADGTFTVDLHLAAQLNPDVDCRTTPCAVVTKADHTRLEARDLDVVVPVSFTDANANADADAGGRAWFAPVATGSAVGVLGLVGTAVVIRRRHATEEQPTDGPGAGDA